MGPAGSMPHSQVLSNIPILSRIDPIPRSHTYPAQLKVLDLITLTKLGERYKLIMEPSPLPILILLGTKYLPQDPVFKYP